MESLCLPTSTFCYLLHIRAFTLGKKQMLSGEAYFWGAFAYMKERASYWYFAWKMSGPHARWEDRIRKLKLKCVCCFTAYRAFRIHSHVTFSTTENECRYSHFTDKEVNGVELNDLPRWHSSKISTIFRMLGVIDGMFVSLQNSYVET